MPFSKYFKVYHYHYNGWILFQVAIGTAGEGVLHVGDRVVGLDHLDASQLTHADAQNIFKHAGTSIKLDIVRPSATQGTTMQ